MNLQPSNEQVDGIFAKYGKPGSPGCALAVIRDGEIAYQQGYGLASVELGVPVTPATVFNLGSMSKQFTAFAIALLEAEGRLSLDEDICKYLPEMHKLGHAIAVRHLVHHTSGLRDTFPELLALAEWRQGDVTTTEDVFWLLRRQRELNFCPGEEFQYTNSNYILLALICQRVSGRSLAAFSQERIFEPLGMSSTVIHETILALIPCCAGRYYEDDEGGWVSAVSSDSVVGPTNVYSTVQDLARWDQNFYTGQVGGLSVVTRVLQPGHLNDGTVLDYAYGLQVGPEHRHRGWEMIEHGGEHGGHCSWMVRFPERHLSVVVLFNHFLWDMREYALKVADLFLAERATERAAPAAQAPPVEPAATAWEAAPAEVKPEQLEEKAGTYYSSPRTALRQVTFQEGRLQFQGLDLLPLGGNLFCFEVEPQTRVEFLPAEDGTVAGMKTITSSGEYTYERVESVAPTPEMLAEYAGCFYSPELDIWWTLVAEDDHLVAKRRKYVDSRLTLLFRDAFRDDWEPLMGFPATYMVIFERDEGGAIIGLRVSGSGVRRLQFHRREG